jgi:hypothetical protein
MPRATGRNADVHPHIYIFYYIISYSIILYHIILYYIILYSYFLVLYYIIFYYIIYRIQGQHASKAFASVYTEKPRLCTRAAEALDSCCYGNGIGSGAKDECQSIRRSGQLQIHPFECLYRPLQGPLKCLQSPFKCLLSAVKAPSRPCRAQQGHN